MLKYGGWLIGMGLICITTVTQAEEVVSEIVTSTAKPTPQVDQQLLDDLARIRKQMGGSVLSGSMLDDEGKDSDSAFQSGVQSLLEGAEAQDRSVRPPRFNQPLDTPPKSDDSTRSPQDRFISTLREQGSKLDRIANELEKLKQYEHADELRESAKALRELARSIDGVPALLSTLKRGKS